MGLRDVVFGRKKLAEPKDDRLFALATAAVTLDTDLGLKTAGVAAVTFKPLSSGEFSRVDSANKRSSLGSESFFRPKTTSRRPNAATR